MKSDVVSIDTLSQAILDNLSRQNVKVKEKVDKEVRKVSREAIKIISASAPIRTGIYKKSFSLKKVKQGTYVIHSKTRYQLTHLLEHSHLLRNGTSSKPTPHIIKGEEYAQKELPNRIKKIIEENV